MAKAKVARVRLTKAAREDQERRTAQRLRRRGRRQMVRMVQKALRDVLLELSNGGRLALVPVPDATQMVVLKVVVPVPVPVSAGEPDAKPQQANAKPDVNVN